MNSRAKLSPNWFRRCVTALSLFLVCLHSGCVSSSYKSARKDTPPAALLNLAATPATADSTVKPAAEISLNSVIIYQGPGSWKREAYWDEYVVTIANRGDSAMTIDAATLTDFQNLSVSPGTNPWALEKQSRSYADRFRSGTGTALKIGGSAVVVTAVGGFIGGASAASSAAYFAEIAGAAAGAMVAVPIFAGATIYRNVSNRHHIQSEFRSRCLPLPLMLTPGQLAHGSLFFRITPGPRRLTLHSSAADGRSTDTIIELEPLAGLHLQSTADSTKKF